MAALSAEQRATQEDGCSQAREDHRIQQTNLDIQARALGVSEGNLRLTVRQSWSSFIQTLATVAAFVAAALAAFVAWRAAEWAKQAAIHTQDSAKIAKETFDATTRPYLHFGCPDGTGPLTRDSVVKVHLKNWGQAPALKISLWMGIKNRPYPIGAFSPELKEIDGAAYLPPGDELKVGVKLGTHLQPAAFAEIQLGRAVLLVRAKVIYIFAPEKADGLEVTLVIDQHAILTGDVHVLDDEERQQGPRPETS